MVRTEDASAAMRESLRGSARGSPRTQGAPERTGEPGARRRGLRTSLPPWALLRLLEPWGNGTPWHSPQACTLVSSSLERRLGAKGSAQSPAGRSVAPGVSLQRPSPPRRPQRSLRCDGSSALVSRSWRHKGQPWMRCWRAQGSTPSTPPRAEL